MGGGRVGRCSQALLSEELCAIWVTAKNNSSNLPPREDRFLPTLQSQLPSAFLKPSEGAGPGEAPGSALGESEGGRGGGLQPRHDRPECRGLGRKGRRVGRRGDGDFAWSRYFRTFLGGLASTRASRLTRARFFRGG